MIEDYVPMIFPHHRWESPDRYFKAYLDKMVLEHQDIKVGELAKLILRQKFEKVIREENEKDVRNFFSEQIIWIKEDRLRNFDSLYPEREGYTPERRERIRKRFEEHLSDYSSPEYVERKIKERIESEMKRVYKYLIMRINYRITSLKRRGEIQRRR